jgi:3-isopropylmalate dehydratase small subunit
MNPRTLVNGLDEFSLTLQCADMIRAHEARRPIREPWLY